MYLHVHVFTTVCFLSNQNCCKLMLTIMLFFCDWLQQSSFLLTLDVKFCFKAFF